MRICAALVGITCIASLASATVLLGPTPYLSTADSPFLASDGFQLENFEDGLFNLLGATSSAAQVVGPGGIIDSVDGDDGNIDGLGQAGHSYFNGAGSTGITIFFSDPDTLPQRAGLVWTDGAGVMTFDAFDAAGALIGTISAEHADTNFNGGTAEDRFYGIEHEAGIASIRMRNSSGGIEIDHVQYAYIPAPAGVALMGAGLVLRSRRRR